MRASRILAVPGFFALVLLASARPVSQSGRGGMHGYVAFEGFSYNDVLEGAMKAKVELRATGEFNHSVYTAETDKRGSYEFPSISLGDFTLKITAPGYTPYQIDIYIPSDFDCRLAVNLRKARAGRGK
jgi:hypothetical protein